jgi:predicted negative regulator of RcsB-dependent stress response
MTKPDEKAVDFRALYARYRVPATWAVAVIIAGGAGVWFWRSSRALKESNAERAYYSAEASYYGGNLDLAEGDLRRVSDRYSGTSAGVRATMLLARTLYQRGKAAEAIARLDGVVGSGAAKPFRSALYALIAVGLEDQNKFAEAADAYQKAANSAVAQNESDVYMASRARALTSAGNKEEAIRIWRSLSERETSPVSAEAKLRLGELIAGPAKRG